MKIQEPKRITLVTRLYALIQNFVNLEGDRKAVKLYPGIKGIWVYSDFRYSYYGSTFIGTNESCCNLGVKRLTYLSQAVFMNILTVLNPFAVFSS